MSREKNIETCLVLSTGFIVLFLIYKVDSLLWLAVSFGLIGIFLNTLALKITWFWYKFAELLGLFVPKILLSLVFFLVLYPVAILYRLFTKERQVRLKKRINGSYWKDRKHNYAKEDLEKMW